MHLGWKIFIPLTLGWTILVSGVLYGFLGLSTQVILVFLVKWEFLLFIINFLIISFLGVLNRINFIIFYIY